MTRLNEHVARICRAIRRCPIKKCPLVHTKGRQTNATIPPLFTDIYLLLSASLNALTERNTVPPTLSKHFPCHYFIPIVGCSTVYLQGDGLRANSRALHQTARSLSNLYPQSCPYSNVFVYCRIHFTKLYAAWQAILKTSAVFADFLPIQQPQQKKHSRLALAQTTV